MDALRCARHGPRANSDDLSTDLVGAVGCVARARAQSSSLCSGKTRDHRFRHRLPTLEPPPVLDAIGGERLVLVEQRSMAAPISFAGRAPLAWSDAVGLQPVAHQLCAEAPGRQLFALLRFTPAARARHDGALCIHPPPHVLGEAAGRGQGRCFSAARCGCCRAPCTSAWPLCAHYVEKKRSSSRGCQATLPTWPVRLCSSRTGCDRCARRGSCRHRARSLHRS